MVWVKGQSGNPEGGRNRKIFLDALNSLITASWDGSVPELPEKPLVAHAMAQRLVSGAFRDDWRPGESLAYIQEICNRAYGKCAQPIVGDSDFDPVLMGTIDAASKSIASTLDQITAAKSAISLIEASVDREGKAEPTDATG